MSVRISLLCLIAVHVILLNAADAGSAPARPERKNFSASGDQHLRAVRDRIVSRDYRTDFNTLVLGEFFDKKRIREAEKSWTAIPRKDLRVSQHDGRCRLTDPNGVPLNGLCNLELQDNFFFAGEFRDGMMDGIAVGYCGWPYPRYFAMGRYRNGIPYHGSMFLFLREDLIVTHWLLHYENGVFHAFTGFSSSLSPFKNETDARGRIVNGYELHRIHSPDDISFHKIIDGRQQGIVHIRDFAKIGFDPALNSEYFNSLLAWAKDVRIRAARIPERKNFSASGAALREREPGEWLGAEWSPDPLVRSIWRKCLLNPNSDIWSVRRKLIDACGFFMKGNSVRFIAMYEFFTAGSAPEVYYSILVTDKYILKIIWFTPSETYLYSAHAVPAEFLSDLKRRLSKLAEMRRQREVLSANGNLSFVFSCDFLRDRYLKTYVLTSGCPAEPMHRYIAPAAVPDDTDPNAPAVILYDIVRSIKQHTARSKQNRPIYFFDQDFSCMKNCFFLKALP